MTVSDLLHQSNAILPELIIGLTLCAVIFVDMFTPRLKSRAVAGSISLAGTVWSLLVLAGRIGSDMAAYRSYTFGGMVTHDLFRFYFDILLLLGTAATVLFAMRSRETESYRHGEFFSLVLGGLLGAMLLVASDNFLMFMLGLETLSLCSFVLAAALKHDRLSAEAGLKYAIFGIVANAVMLFGISYFYGISGTLAIGEGVRTVAERVASGQVALLTALLSFLFILGGVGFKIAMVPFHFWCPDVYQGSPTPVTAYLSVVSKAAGFGALLRIVWPGFIGVSAVEGNGQGLLTFDAFTLLFGVIAVVTMTLGNFVALRQTNIKRLLAYSSIAHAGYLLLGFTVNDSGGRDAVLLYLFIYLFMNLGAFWIAIVLINRTGSAEIASFNGTALRAPLLFVAMFIFLVSLTGIPPTAGFAAKFILFKVVVGAGITHMATDGSMTPMAAFYFALAVIGVLNSVVSLYYYMKIARVMAFVAPDTDAPLGESTVDRVYAVAFAVPTVLLLNFAPILALIQAMAK